MADENDRPDSIPNFDINAEYQAMYLKSNYQSDEYYELFTMEQDLDYVVINKVWKLENFASLRPMKAEDLTDGQEVKVNNERKAKIVKKINSGAFIVRFNDGKEMNVKIANIEPAVDPVMKLKKPQVRELYEICYEALLEKTKYTVDIVYFFYTFSNYFRINDKYLIACLPPKTQGKLVEEAIKRTDYKIKEGIHPIFLSP